MSRVGAGGRRLLFRSRVRARFLHVGPGLHREITGAVHLDSLPGRSNTYGRLFPVAGNSTACSPPGLQPSQLNAGTPPVSFAVTSATFLPVGLFCLRRMCGLAFQPLAATG
jgi:hypothetical protein